MKESYLAHGKVILVGEHSVVYGYDALALPITALNIETSVEDSGQMWMDTTAYQGPFFEAPSEYDGLKYVVKTMLEKAGQENATIKITYKGQIPMERGLGSSATVALGTTRALDKFYNLHLSEKEIMDITNHAEMINHGKASGLDAATVNSDFLVFFNKKIGPQKLETKLGATLLIMDTGELGNTKKAVTMVKEKIDSTEADKQNLANLGTLADEAKDAWMRHDAKTVGEKFNQIQTILAEFGLSTEKINKLDQIAHENGSLGFKLSGGGLGGVVISLCENKNAAEKIAHESKDLIDGYWIEEV